MNKQKKKEDLIDSGYCSNCMVSDRILNCPKEQCRCRCHKLTPPPEKKKQSKEKWENELRLILEIAPSFDDASDVECGIRFVRNLLKERLSLQKKELIEKIKGMKLGGHRDEDKRIYAGGYDTALDDLLSLLQEK